MAKRKKQSADKGIYLRGNIWWLRYTNGEGKQILESARTCVKEDAINLLEKKKAELWLQSQMGKKPERTWAQAVVRWMDEKWGKKKSLDDDINHCSFISGIIKDMPLSSIDEDVIAEIRAARIRKQTPHGGEIKPASVNRMLEVLRAILNAARDEWRWIDSVPNVKMLPANNRRVRWLTQVQAGKLLDELPEHLRGAAKFSLATGIRASNCINLRWVDVDLPSKRARLWADETKAGNNIGIPLNQDAIDALLEQDGKHDVYVFTYRPRGSGAYRRFERFNEAAWRKALDRAQIRRYEAPPSAKNTRKNSDRYPMWADDEYAFDDFDWHDLRHTWASWHVQSGTSLHVLKELGGWSSIDIVIQRYAHLNPDSHHADASRIEMAKLAAEEEEAASKVVLLRSRRVGRSA